MCRKKRIKQIYKTRYMKNIKKTWNKFTRQGTLKDQENIKQVHKTSYTERPRKHETSLQDQVTWGKKKSFTKNSQKLHKFGD